MQDLVQIYVHLTHSISICSVHNFLSKLTGEFTFLKKKRGRFIFTTILNVDKVRGALARDVACLSTPQWLETFEVDHTIYTWRLHNAVSKNEELVLRTVENAAGCKLGKWMANAPEAIKARPAFQDMYRYHLDLHKKGVECYNEIQEGRFEAAEKRATEADAILKRMLDALHTLQKDPLLR